MRDSEIEAWALRIAENIARGADAEHDDRVECKGEWPEPRGVARQLAGHANAARGEPILWLVGLDEVEGPKVCKPVEISRWWQAVEARFDGIAPELARHLVVPVADERITALLFETVRGPFVVKSSTSGDDRLEVPWRDGARTRSARREEVLRILVPAVTAPTFELLDGTFDVSVPKSETFEWDLSLNLQMYAHAVFNSVVVIPDHRCSARLLEGTNEVVVLENARLAGREEYPGASSSPNRIRPASRLDTVHAGDRQVVIAGPGRFTARAHLRAENSRWQSEDAFPSVLQARFEIHPIDFDTPLQIGATLVREDPPTNPGTSYEHIVRWRATA